MMKQKSGYSASHAYRPGPEMSAVLECLEDLAMYVVLGLACLYVASLFS